MSIVVNLYYTGKDGNARKFVEEMEHRGIAERIRQEDGNVRYDYYLPINNPETVLLIDQWVNQEALDKHHATQMMEEIIQLREKYDLHMRIERYVEDTEGIPEKDLKFIVK